MEKIKIFGNELLVKDYICSNDPNYIVKSKPTLRLFIKFTDDCNANCKFCANNLSKDYGKIDLKKLEYVIRYLSENNILHGISITGGEPMLYPQKLNDLVNLIYKIDPNMELQISTNGTNLESFKYFDNVNKLESIHISRHHYLDYENYEIFQNDNVSNTDSIMELQEFLTDKRIININTIVMKDYIDSLKEIKRMLNHVGDLGVYKNGFVSLMKCNEYSFNNFINFNSIFKNLDSSFFRGHHFYSGKYCECIDGIYLTDNNKLVEYYARMIKETEMPYVYQLVYTSDNKLKSGFNGKVLLK